MLQSEEERILTLITRKLMGEATSSELEELESFISRYPAYAEKEARLSEVWSKPPVVDREFVEATFVAHTNRMKDFGYELTTISDELTKKPFWLTRKKVLYPVLALFVLVVTISIYRFTANKNRPTETAAVEINNEVSTRNGSRTQIQLLDGSTVWLNAGSKLNYGKDFGQKQREVYLTGEAFFDVVKNPHKPFIIHTKAIDVRVLGTQFNVRSYPTDKIVETSLIRGVVEVLVKGRGEKWVIHPNEKLLVENVSSQEELQKKPETIQPVRGKMVEVAIKPLTYQFNDSVAVEAAWVKNKLSFKDEPFSEVAKKLERWYDIEIEFKNESAKNLMMKGTFVNETLQKALEALEFSFGFKYSLRGNKVIIY